MRETQPFDRHALVISVLFIFIIILLSGLMSVYLLASPSVKQAMLMVKVVDQIDKNYYEDIDYESSVSSGRQAMFDQLDRYSSYFSVENFNALDQNLSGGYDGIGISVITHDSGLVIMFVRENGPAGEAGLMVGDIITQVDSVKLNGLENWESLEHLRGDEGSLVNLIIFRQVDLSTFELNITRRRMEFMHVPFAGYTEDSVIYLRLLDFDAGAAEELEQSLDSLLEKSDNPRGIILDLRGNPGGLFREARAVANLFLEDNIFMVGNDARSRWQDRDYFSSGVDITDGLPMTVLVDRNSASASEVVSGALKYADRAILIGDTTFGKGLVQGFVRYPDGDGMRLTISRYFFENGIYLNDFDSALIDTGHGLVPDIYYTNDYDIYFRREIESSSMLRLFAIEYESEIVEAYKKDSLDDRWIDSFISFITAKNSRVDSYTTYLAEDMKIIADSTGAGEKMVSAVDRLIDLSHRLDIDYYYYHKGYIKYRITKLAVERNENIYQAYKKVILKHLPHVKLAEEYLLAKKND